MHVDPQWRALSAAAARLVDSRLESLLDADPARIRPTESPVAWGDISKARKTVGWEPEYPLEDTLRNLVDYWKGSLKG